MTWGTTPSLGAMYLVFVFRLFGHFPSKQPMTWLHHQCCWEGSLVGNTLALAARGPQCGSPAWCWWCESAVPAPGTKWKAKDRRIPGSSRDSCPGVQSSTKIMTSKMKAEVHTPVQYLHNTYTYTQMNMHTHTQSRSMGLASTYMNLSINSSAKESS